METTLDEYNYKILNIEPTQDISIIKKAYRTLSFKYHPDKNNNDPQKNKYFNQITAAYNSLINKYKKNDMLCVHDHYNNFKTINESNFFNNNRNFNQSKNNTNIISNNSENEINKDLIPLDINVNLNISYTNAYYGANLPINITRKIVNYNSKSEENETIYVSIPKGIDNNEFIIINNKGNMYNNYYTNIKVTIKLINNEVFTRKGLNLIYIKDITFKESLIGFSFNLMHLNNKLYKLHHNTDEIITIDTIKTIPNMGFERDNYTGDLIIKFNILYPKVLSKDIKSKLNEIL